MVKRKIYCAFLFSFILCFVLALGVFANTTMNDNDIHISGSGTYHINENFVTSDVHQNYFNDISFCIPNSNNSTQYYVVFKCVSFKAIVGHIKNYYLKSDMSQSYCDFWKFSPDFPQYSALKNSNYKSNYLEFSQGLNKLATVICEYTNQLDLYLEQYSVYVDKYYELKIEYDEYVEQAENNYSNLLTLYNETLSLKNDLSTRLDNLKNDYDKLLNDYDDLDLENEELLEELNTLKTDYLNLQVQCNNLQAQVEEEHQKLLNVSDTFLAFQENHNLLVNDYNNLYAKYNTLLETSKYNYNIGYNQGVTDGEALEEGFITIFSSPMYIFGEIFDFELFGINFLSIIQFIFTISIVGFVLSKIRS